MTRSALPRLWRVTALVLGVCAWRLAVPDVAAACDLWAFRNRGYFDPLLADIRAANISATAVGYADAPPFAQRPGKRFVWDISLGKEIPLAGCEVGSGDEARLSAGEWGIGVWLPISFHMIEGFKDDSNPILNTDYRFSGMVKWQRGLSARSQLGARLQVGHESTHLGDEFTITARRTHPDFERVNVSYEYWEYGVSFERHNADETDFLVFRHGGIGLIDPGRGYYGTVLLEPDGRIVTRSTGHFEPSFGVQWIHSRDEAERFRFGPFVSADVRWRTVYSYDKASDAAPDPRQLSVNLLVGLRRPGRGYQEKGVPDVFFRIYHGVNPHGQFRSQRGYTLVGFGLIVEL